MNIQSCNFWSFHCSLGLFIYFLHEILFYYLYPFDVAAAGNPNRNLIANLTQRNYIWRVKHKTLTNDSRDQRVKTRPELLLEEGKSKEKSRKRPKRGRELSGITLCE